MAVKAISQAEELVHAIAPDLPLVDTIVDEAQGLLASELSSADRALQSGLAGSLQEVVQQASVLGLRFIPRLLEVSEVARSILGQQSPEERLAADIRASFEGLGRRVDVQLGRLAHAVAWAGVALGTGLGAIAFLARPSTLEGVEVVVIAIPIAAGALIAWLVRGWRTGSPHPAGLEGEVATDR